MSSHKHTNILQSETTSIDNKRFSDTQEHHSAEQVVPQLNQAPIVEHAVKGCPGAGITSHESAEAFDSVTDPASSSTLDLTKPSTLATTQSAGKETPIVTHIRADQREDAALTTGNALATTGNALSDPSSSDTQGRPPHDKSTFEQGSNSLQSEKEDENAASESHTEKDSREALIKALKDNRNQLILQNARFNQQINDLKGKESMLWEAIKDRDIAIFDLRRRLDTALERSKVDSDLVPQLQRKNHGLQEDLRNSRLAMDQIQTNADSFTQLLMPEMDDSHWRMRFEQLANLVQTFAGDISRKMVLTERTKGKDPLINLEPKYKDEIFTVLPRKGAGIPELLFNVKSSLKRRLFIQGWINLAICKFIFSHGTRYDPALFKDDPTQDPGSHDIWLGARTSTAVKQLEIEIGNGKPLTAKTGVDTNGLHKWRTLTMSVLRRKKLDATGISSDYNPFFEKRCEDMVEILYELAVCPEDFDRELYSSKLMSIFESAGNLSADLRTQKALFYFRFPMDASHQFLRRGHERSTIEKPAAPDTQEDKNPYEVLFDSTWMRAERDEDRNVEIVVGPAILRSGSGHGESYEGEPGLFQHASVYCAAKRNIKTGDSGKSFKSRLFGS